MCFNASETSGQTNIKVGTIESLLQDACHGRIGGVMMMSQFKIIVYDFYFLKKESDF